MVVGDTPDELIKKYDAALEVEPYIKYYYKDISKYRKKAIKVAQDLVDNADKLELTPFMKEYFDDKIKSLKKLTDFGASSRRAVIQQGISSSFFMCPSVRNRILMSSISVQFSI